MLDLSRMFPARVFIHPLLVGSLLFIIQIGYFTWSASTDCSTSLDNLGPDCLWYVYEKVPKVLPMAAVYAAIGGVVSQIVNRFMFSGPTVGQVRKAARERPKRLIPLILRYCVISAAIIVLSLESTSLSPHIPNALTMALVCGFVLIMVDPWATWVGNQISVGEANTKDET